MRIRSATEERYLLVTEYRVLPSSARSYLDLLTVYTPADQSNVFRREWAHAVWVDELHGATVVHLTPSGVHWLLAIGVSCRALSTPAAGMRATHVRCERKVGGVLELQEECVEIVRAEKDAPLALQPTVKYDGLLVALDGSLLATRSGGGGKYSEYYSLAEIVADFLDDRSSQIRYRSPESEYHIRNSG